MGTSSFFVGKSFTHEHFFHSDVKLLEGMLGYAHGISLTRDELRTMVHYETGNEHP